MKYDNQADPNVPLPKGRRHIIIEVTCREETIGDNIRRGEIVAGLKDRKMVTKSGVRITENNAYFWHPLSVCCSSGTVTIDGETKDVQDLTLDEFSELPGSANTAWVHELTEANPDLFQGEPVDQKKSMNT